MVFFFLREKNQYRQLLWTDRGLFPSRNGAMHTFDLMTTDTFRIFKNNTVIKIIADP